MTRIKPNRGAHVLLFPTPAPGTIKIIGLYRNAGSQKGVGRIEPDNFYSTSFAQRALFAPLSSLSFPHPAGPAAAPQHGLLRSRSCYSSRVNDKRLRRSLLEHACVASVNCTQAGQDSACCKRGWCRCCCEGKGEGDGQNTKRFLPHQTHRSGAGKMLLENYSKGSCVAQFHCRDRHIEKFSLHRRFL